MKKLVLLLTVAIVALSMAACTTEAEALVIFQNKVEIDDVLNTYAQAWSEETGIPVEVKTCGGDTCAYGTQILAEFQADKQPDIFVIEGMGGYNVYKDKILNLTGEAWAADTDLEFKVSGVTYGFPVAVEAWGMAYNEEILTAAFAHEGLSRTIASLEDVSQAEYAEVFAAVQAYFDATTGMEDYAVVSMAAGPGMEWVTGLHNFNGYLSAGLAYSDSSVIDDLNAGIVQTARLDEYVGWVDVLFEYADQTILTTGGYDEQVGKFAIGEAAFLHQGNWTDSSYADSDFEMGYLPHATMATGNDSIFIGAPSYYVINIDTNMSDEAKQFLNDLASTPEGHDYMVNQAHMVPAFNSVTLVPSTPLSAAAMEWNQAGKAYAWWQNDMPSGFGMEVLGPIYSLYAAGTIDRAAFIQQITDEIEGLA
ncbi:MAG: ABC transporter substrate-binding protein [Bacillota bacterium]